MTTQIPQDFTKDICNDSFYMRELPLAPDRFGESNAVLVYRPSDMQSKKAVLYIHGFIDYFFQWEMADFFNAHGFNFFAIDLRRYGRALHPGQKPNIIEAMEDYYEELDKAVDIIKNEVGNEFILLKGHSTGGLIASLYANDNPEVVDAVILNSAFFEFNISPFERYVLMPLVKLLHGVLPKMGLDSLGEAYPKSLHKDYHGEWDFNTKWKPIENFPAFMAWLNAIRNGHERVHKGLNIKAPVLSMFSSKSYKKKKYDPVAQESDAVLDVEHISKYSGNLGDNVTKLEIENGMHDLVLSRKDVREKVYQEMEKWLSENGFI